MGFHEYRFDWLPDRVVFYIDSNPVNTMVHNIPSDAGRLFLNHWSNGSPTWTGGPPLQQAIMTVMYVKTYFNSTNSTRIRTADERCRAGASGKTCAIPDGVTAVGILPRPNPNSTVSASSSLSLAPGATVLPEPGKVPFLSLNPENVIDQDTYNNTYRNPDGTESQQPNPGGKKKSGAEYRQIPGILNFLPGVLGWLIVNNLLEVLYW
jgi:hypothetical protein